MRVNLKDTNPYWKKSVHKKKSFIRGTQIHRKKTESTWAQNKYFNRIHKHNKS